MKDIEPSVWQAERFGDIGTKLVSAVGAAVGAAHADSLAAHDAGGMTHHDTYGNTMKVRVHEHLEAAVRDIEGVSFRKPVEGGRFGLVVVTGTSVAILPIRIGKDPMVTHDRMRLRTPVSEIKQSLLSLTPIVGPRQLTIEEGLQDSDELEAQFVELEELEKELGRLGQVVVVSYGSSPTSGLWDLGWGDLQIEDINRGAVIWSHWERLPLGVVNESGTPDLHAVDNVAGDQIPAARFDHADEDQDFDLSPRRPVEAPPIEPEDPAAEHNIEDSPS